MLLAKNIITCFQNFRSLLTFLLFIPDTTLDKLTQITY